MFNVRMNYFLSFENIIIEKFDLHTACFALWSRMGVNFDTYPQEHTWNALNVWVVLNDSSNLLMIKKLLLMIG